MWVVTDRNTQERKGIAYIKFEKASEAHIAMEKLHGETIGGDSKPLKVSFNLFLKFSPKFVLLRRFFHTL